MIKIDKEEFKMFLEKYLNTTYLELVYSNYEYDYLNSLDKNNFNKIYLLLKENDFYFINDIILNYLELFEIDYKYVKKALLDIKNIFGDNYIKYLGNNMTIIDKIIELAINYSENDNI